MTYVEFLEAFARVVDKLELRRMGGDRFMYYSAKNPYKLDKKLETALMQVFEKCLPKKKFTTAYSKYKSEIDAEIAAEEDQ